MKYWRLAEKKNRMGISLEVYAHKNQGNKTTVTH